MHAINKPAPETQNSTSVRPLLDWEVPGWSVPALIIIKRCKTYTEKWNEKLQHRI